MDREESVMNVSGYFIINQGQNGIRKEILQDEKY
jgi:hypothetical protein